MKRALKTTAKIFSILLVIGLIFLAFCAYHDESPTPEATAFFHTDAPVADGKNGYVALAGLDAPSKAEMITYGKKAIEQSLEPKEDIVGSPKLSTIECWIGSPDTSETACLSKAELEKILANNKTLLTHYQAVYGYPRFVMPSGGIYYGSRMIKLQELLMAQLSLTAQSGDADAAMQGWIANTRFVQRAIADRHTMVGYAILLVLENMSINAYPMIAAQLTPAQLANYRPQLEAIFNTPAFGKGGADIAMTMRAEYELARPLLSSQKKIAFLSSNSTTNGLYQHARDMVTLSQTPLHEIEEAATKSDEKWRSKRVCGGSMGYIARNAYNIRGKLLSCGFYTGDMLLPAAAMRTTQFQLLKLYTQARIEQVAVEDMGKFVAQSSIHNPLTTRAFDWDEKKAEMSFTMKNKIQFSVQYSTATQH